MGEGKKRRVNLLCNINNNPIGTKNSEMANLNTATNTVKSVMEIHSYLNTTRLIHYILLDLYDQPN